MNSTAAPANSISSREIAFAYYDESFRRVSLGLHHHTQNEMIFVKQGSCLFQIAGRPHVVRAGQVLLISALENHSTRVLEVPYRRYAFVSSMNLCSDYIHDQVLESAYIFSHQRQEAITLPSPLAEEIERDFKVLVGETAGHMMKWKERSAGILLDILIQLYRVDPSRFLQETNQKNLNVIFSVKGYLEKHFDEPLTLEAVAQKFFISKYYLSHQFKKIIGYGFRHYIQLLRIHKAKVLLQDTDLSVTEICCRVGYNNINYFIRLFEKKEGLTPFQYRKLYFNSEADPRKAVKQNFPENPLGANPDTLKSR
jgi:AraC-like DNA-binding protein